MTAPTPAPTPASWFPARPAFLPPVGGAAAWALEELAPFDADLGADDELAEAAAPPPDLEALRAAEEARRAAERAAERERIAAEAYAAGLAEGEAAGRAAEAARLAGAVAAAEQALARLHEGAQRWTETLEENVCALAIGVARQLVGRELAGDSTALTELVRRALAEFPLDQAVVIRLHPGDLATLASAHAASPGATGATAVAPNRQARWVADVNVAAGGCVVEGRERIVDGRVDAALERLYRRLTGNHA